jgi:hypothetical protein
MKEVYQFGSPNAMFLIGEIKASLPGLAIETVFDIGADKGQSLGVFLPAFPSAARRR